MATQIEQRDPGRMHAWDATRACVGRFTAQVATALGLSASTVEKWKRSSGAWHDTGIRGPVERVALMIDTVIALGRDELRAMMPVAYLANRRGYGLYSLDGSQDEPRSPLGMLANWSQRAGTLSSVFALTYEDGRVDPHERRMMKEQIDDARHQLDQIELALNVRAA